jgi:hypothetical protein
MRLIRLTFVFGLVLSAVPALAAGFDNWGAVVVAGDWRAHDGEDSPVFDDARRDLVSDLQRIGFKRDNIVQFSAQSEKFSEPDLRASTGRSIANALWDVSDRAKGGCFLYITSHGSSDGVRVGPDIVSPVDLAIMVNNACHDRPAVVVVSACFSGVFVTPLSAPNRLVITAARPDRTSFGCGAQEKYTYFDDCMLASWRGAHDFPDIGLAAQTCVARKEQVTGMSPPSEPQVWQGTLVDADVPHW